MIKKLNITTKLYQKANKKVQEATSTTQKKKKENKKQANRGTQTKEKQGERQPAEDRGTSFQLYITQLKENPQNSGRIETQEATLYLISAVMSAVEEVLPSMHL